MSGPLRQSRLQTRFLACMAALLAVFLLLLFCGDLGGQSDAFYLGGEDFQADTLNTEAYARELDPYGFSQGADFVPFKDANYPPLAYVLFHFLDALSGRDIASPRALAVSLLFGAACVVLLYFALLRLLDAPQMRRAPLAAVLVLSAPTVFALERGNIILLTAVLCCWFLMGYQSDRRVLRELSFLALAVAAALKIFPALLGLLLLFEKRWRDALRLALYGLCAVFLPFLCIKGGFSNLPLLFQNFGAHAAYYTRLIYPRFGFRLFASLTYDAPFVNPLLNDQLWKLGDKLFRFMPTVDALLSCFCLFHAARCKRRFEAVTAIMLVMVNYPVNSGRYTALYLLPAAALLLSEPAPTRRDLPLIVLLPVILSPLQLPLPYALFGVSAPILCNLSDILRNLAAYALFVLFAYRGAVGLFNRIRPVFQKQPPPASAV